MSSRHLLTVILATSFAFVAEAASEADAIRAARAASNDAIARHDVDALISFLDSEYQITTGSGMFSSGIEQERENVRAIFARHEDVIYVRTPTQIELSPTLPHAFERGTWRGEWTTPAGPQRYRGDYAAYWRRVEGAWKIRSELFVTTGCEGPACPGSTISSDAVSSDVAFLAAPGSPYPFSEAVRVGNMLYLSGRIGTDPETGKLVSGGIAAETRRTMDNIGRTLRNYGSSFDRVVKCTVMLDDMKDWPAMNEVYRTYFDDHFPARSALGADGLALGALVEIECWATVD